MILVNAASRYTRVAAGQTAASIFNGETIRVHGIVISGSASGTVLVLDSSSATIATLNVTSGDSFELKTGFIADKGLAITTDANTTCTVFHSSGGA